MEDNKKNILYFYIQKERAAKTHFWTKPELPVTRISMGKDGELICCCVPEYYIGNRSWEADRLLENLNEILKRQECEDYYLQPELAGKLGIDEKLPPECLMRGLFRQIPCLEYLFYIGCRVKGEKLSESNFCGAEVWEEKQRIRELLSPYFTRINHVNLVTDEPQAYEELAEYIYMEYGIPTAYADRLDKNWGRDGKTVILDGRKDYKIPWMALPAGACYVDFWSSEAKCLFLSKMRKDVRYMSVVKFLDTLMKNGYNTIVN